MKTRPLGGTGIEVPILGFGAGSIGGFTLTEDEAGRLLNEVVDLGVTLFDTARSYGTSEERIGRHLSPRRAEIVLSTKVGYGVSGVPDWTGECIRLGIDGALERLRTDHIDIVHLHSCPLGILQRDDVLEALGHAIEAGKVRVAAYSGENEALGWAIDCGRFGSVQTSVSVCDQRGIGGHVTRASERGLGVIGKRPLANSPWAREARPADDDAAAAYFDRFRAMGFDAADPRWRDRALRFAAFAPGVHAVVCGSSCIQHVRENVESVLRGSLPTEEIATLRDAFRGEWAGMI